MTKLILDTNIIIRFPQVLGLTIEDMELIVPSIVLDELSHIATKNNNVADLLKFAVLDGNIQVVDSKIDFSELYDKINNPRLSIGDKTILAIALESKKKGQTVKIATQDKVIQEVAEQNNIEFLNWTSIANLLKSQKGKTPEKPLNDKISKFERKSIRTYIVGVLTGVLSSIIATLIYKNLQLIVDTINVWGTILLVLVIGVGLFIYREKQRLSYGIFEIAVGIIAIITLFSPSGFSYSDITFDMNFNLKLLGGLYIMVRGQDNVVKAIKNKKFGLWLKDKIGIG